MNDDQIRALLDDAVADVAPREALDAIRSRTRRQPARRPWLWATGGAVLATAATVAVVAALGMGPGTPTADPGFAGSPSAAVRPATSAPTPAASHPATSAPGSAATSASPEPTKGSAPTHPRTVVPVYYVGDTSHGLRLFREFHGTTNPDPLAGAVQLALDGTADDPDYHALWPAGTTVARVRDDGVLSVDFGGTSPADRPDGMTAQQATLSVQQLVYTVQGAAQARPRVEFSLDGNPLRTLLGVPVADGIAQGPASDLLAQVRVDNPTNGSTVRSPFRVDGSAAAFEANVQWELEQDGRVVRRGSTTAAECCTLSPYSFTVEAPPGRYTLVVHDEDASGGEGLAPWQDTKRITVE